MNLEYIAFDKSGAERTGTLEAPSVEDGKEILRKKGYFVSAISEGHLKSRKVTNGKSSHKSSKASSKKVSPKIVAGFARELAVLVSTGTPLVDAISSIERQSKNAAWTGVLSQIKNRLEEGDPLSVALEQHDSCFNSVFRSLVSAGESSGSLDEMLHRIAVLTRKQEQIRSNVFGAMVYPLLLLGVSTIVIGLLIGVVLPRFAGMFETLDTELPASTAFLMGISEFVRGYWWGLIPAVIGMIIGAIWWINHPNGERVIGRIALSVPKFGQILRSFMTARITRLLGILLEAKVPMLEAIELTKESVGMETYKNMMASASDSVTKGEPISVVLGKGDLIVPSACEAIRNGEQSGRLADVLVHVADYLDEDNDIIVKSISTLIEPVIMIGLGILVGFVAISMFLPLFDLTASAGGGV